MRRLAGDLLVSRRRWVELVVAGLVVAGFLFGTGASNFDETLSDARRATLYGSIASTSGALLGFTLAGLAILVALPSHERIEALRRHKDWAQVPGAYFAAARALLATLVLSTLGIALDSAKDAWHPYGAVTLAITALALVRVFAAVVALDQIIHVSEADHAPRRRIDDPGI